MDLVEGRRLTGPNLLTDGPGVAVEVRLAPGEDPGPGLTACRERLAHMAAALDWHGLAADLRLRRHAHGATLAFAAPVDTLHAAVAVAEWAVAGRSPDVGDETIDQAIQRFRALRDGEAHPALRALLAAAEHAGAPALWDDDEVSLGLGRHARTWPARSLPAVHDVDFAACAGIPHALVTGTNGKTTTSRLLSRMVRCAGLRAGTTATDGLYVDGHLVEAGDWTGPGAARRILRDPRVEVGVLETARGGMLRRGLATTWADAAVVTNVTDDHLGEWGIDTVAEMAEAKLVVRKGLRRGGLLVLNAASAPLVAAVQRLGIGGEPLQIAWFSRDSDDPHVVAARAAGGTAAWDEAGQLVLLHAGATTPVLALPDIPITFGGAALHNVENALAAVLLAAGLGLPVAAMRDGLRAFRPDVHDNPGRANVLHYRGADILVDFAHNPDGVRRLAAMVAGWPARRRLVILGQAGDRADEAIRELVHAALECRPDCVVVKDSHKYLRGRQPGEVPALLRAELLRCGLPAEALIQVEDEPASLRAALAWSQPGDLLLLLVHDDFAAALDLLRTAGATD